MKKNPLIGLLLAVCIINITECKAVGNSSESEEKKEKYIFSRSKYCSE